MKKSILFLFSFLSLAFVSNIDAKDPSTARKKNLAELDQTVMPESYDSSYDSPFAGPNEFGTESKIAKPKGTPLTSVT